MIQRSPHGVRIRFQVVPQSSKTSLVGSHNGALKIKIAAPPVDGAANEELICFLKRLLCVPRQNIRLIQGHTSKIKIVEVVGISIEEAQLKLSL